MKTILTTIRPSAEIPYYRSKQFNEYCKTWIAFGYMKIEIEYQTETKRIVTITFPNRAKWLDWRHDPTRIENAVAARNYNNANGIQNAGVYIE